MTSWNYEDSEPNLFESLWRALRIGTSLPFLCVACLSKIVFIFLLPEDLKKEAEKLV